MKLKYYLRGLGAGILFSVLIFVFVVGPKENDITDEDIIRRAKQLGMVEKSDVSIDMEKLRGESKLSTTPPVAPTSVLTPTPTTVPTPTTAPTLTLTPTPTTAPTPTLAPTPTTAPTPTLAPTPTTASSDDSDVNLFNEPVVIEVIRGMTSEQICFLIEKNNLIDDALGLNAYLIQNGYAEHLRVGKFELNTGMTFEEIANRLTN